MQKYGIELTHDRLRAALPDPRAQVRGLAATELAGMNDGNSIPLIEQALGVEKDALARFNIASALVYRLHQRLVDIEGYIALHTNRYSVPVDWIGRRVEVRETKDKIDVQLDARRLVTHQRIAEAEHQRVTTEYSS